jgi:hypothetical protein
MAGKPSSREKKEEENMTHVSHYSRDRGTLPEGWYILQRLILIQKTRRKRKALNVILKQRGWIRAIVGSKHPGVRAVVFSK